MYNYDDLQCLKMTAMSFLKVNNFNTSDDPFSSDFTLRQFKKYTQQTPLNTLLEEKIKEFEKQEKQQPENATGFQKNKKCIENYISDYSKMSTLDQHRNNLSNIYSHNENPDLKILMYFMGDSSVATVSNKYLKIICQIMIYLGCRECVIISYSEPSNQFKKDLLTLNINQEHPESSQIFKVILYTDKNFIDLTKHAYIPEIVKIHRNEEAQKFIDDNSLETVDVLPKILLEDPICKFYRCRMNDIIELVRECGLSSNLYDTQITYRHVVC